MEPNMNPPVSGRPRLLPFRDPAFTWDTFEAFFRDYLDALPRGLKALDGQECRVVSAHLYGRKGDAQKGIDIVAKMSNGQTWVFQCKHYKEWHPADTRAAITACTHVADRKFLLVTCSVSGECHDITSECPGWDLWDEREISSQFLATLDRDAAARLLFAHFGQGWPQELLGITDTRAFMSAEAFFSAFLREKRIFHHRLPLVGREDALAELDAFVLSPTGKVIPLVGRGGLGKSKLLLEWSRGFCERHPDWALRFIRDPLPDLGMKLGQTRRPLVLVIDDAHRWESERLLVFREVAARNDVKLVLSLRPGPLQSIQGELLDAGLDSTEICTPTKLGRLSDEKTADLVKAALGEHYSTLAFNKLRFFARDCPLIAVLAAELIKSGQLDEQSLTDTEDFRRRVFDSLLLDAKSVEEHFGASQTRDFLGLLALLSPVQPTLDFFTSAAKFLGGSLEPRHVSGMLEALESAGLVVDSGGGLRVVPDLLSDHLAYSVCYTAEGASRGFVESVLNHFSPDAFPQLLQHVAESEWRARQQQADASSVVEPLWNWFLGRFRQSSHFERSQAIEQWTKFAPYQPERALELAKVAWIEKQAPPYEASIYMSSKSDSHERVVDRLPTMLMYVAQHHPGQTKACLDLLWEIGSARPRSAHYSETHPVSIIGKIAKYEAWKNFDVQDAVLEWLAVFLRGTEWTESCNEPTWILEQLLKPFFTLGVEEHWSVGRTFSWRVLPLPLPSTSSHRERVVQICERLIAKGDARVTLAVLSVIEHALQRPQLGMQAPPDSYEAEWDVERLKTFRLCHLIAGREQPIIIRERLAGLLRSRLQSERSEHLRRACVELYRNLPASLEDDVLRAVVGGLTSDFHRHPGKEDATRWHRRMQGRWMTFVHSTTAHLIHRNPIATNILSFVAGIVGQATAHGGKPNPGPLFREIARLDSGLALRIADELVENPVDDLAPYFATLVFWSTQGQQGLRANYCLKALLRESPRLQCGAIACLGWWRRDEHLSDKLLRELLRVAESASGSVAEALCGFCWFQENAVEEDWGILAALARNKANAPLAELLISRVADLAKKRSPAHRDNLRDILAAAVQLDTLDHHETIYHLTELCTRHPAEVFELLIARAKAQEAVVPDFQPIPHELYQFSFDGLLDDPHAIQQTQQLEQSLLSGGASFQELKLLHAAYVQTTSPHEDRLLALVDKCSSPEQIDQLTRLARVCDERPLLLACPPFIKALLLKAREHSQQCYAEVFVSLNHLPGPRGSSNGEPDEEWQRLLQGLEDMVKVHQSDPELAPLYQEALKLERQSMAASRSRYAREQVEHDDEF